MYEALSRYAHIGLILILSSGIWSQEKEITTIPCKPLAKMAASYDRLAKPIVDPDMETYDVHYYDLSLDIDAENETINGRVEVHFFPTIQGLNTIALNLSNTLQVDSVYLKGNSFIHDSDILTITLDDVYDPNDDLSVGVAYSGHPLESGFQAFAFDTVGGAHMISTLSEPYGARTWWPCKDVPTDKADSLLVSITVDSSLTAVSNGLLISNRPYYGGIRTWKWKHRYPIATYLVSIAITDYHYWTETFHFADGDSMPLEYWVYQISASQATIDRWNLTANMLQTFNQAFGKYPFSDEKYGMAQFTWGGAMEHQTCSSMGSSGENTIAHELAHQWWGDLVTCSDFHHIWINEGFATYAEALYWGAKNGEAAYHSHMAAKDWDYVGSIYRNDTTNVWSIFDYIVYGKGAWTLHMLRHIMGDEPFFQTLSQYRDDFRFSHASTEDFQAVAESVYGQSLEWFFNQWIYGTGKPSYHWWWRTTSPDELGRCEITLNVNQVQDWSHPTFKMPIDIFFEGSDQDTTLIIWDSLRTQEYTFQLDFTPTTLKFDPDVWVHKTDKHFYDQGLLPGESLMLKAFPNPFNKEMTIPYRVNGGFEGRLYIYDLRGRKIATQMLRHEEPGQYEAKWDARNNDGSLVASGIYIAQIKSSNNQTSSRKITLLK